MKNHDCTRQFSSSVGSVVDVATPSTRKLRALGFLWALIMLFPLAVINYLVFETLTSDESLLSSGRPVLLLGSALMPILAWFSLGSAAQRFSAASSDDRYFRVGPGGISVSIPDDGASATFRFSFQTVKFDLPWDQIKTWYPFVQTMNGVPTDRSIVFETLKGVKVKIKTYHFAEKQTQIAERIKQARTLPATSVENEDDRTQAFTSLPPGITEASFQIKKKKDLLKEIDLRAVPDGHRHAYIRKVADLLEAKVASLCPASDGYRYSRKQYRPFPEWKNVFGIRLFVQHGLLSGYEIQVEPNDSECRKLTISLCSSNLITDICKYISIAIGIVFLVISFRSVRSIEHALGDFSQLAPLIVVAVALLAAAGSMKLWQLPIRLLQLLVSDKQKEEAHKQQIKLGVQEVAVS